MYCYNIRKLGCKVYNGTRLLSPSGRCAWLCCHLVASAYNNISVVILWQLHISVSRCHLVVCMHVHQIPTVLQNNDNALFKFMNSFMKEHEYLSGNNQRKAYLTDYVIDLYLGTNIF
jgi:hypothetical protein